MMKENAGTPFYSVAVIGGGASGMAAAIATAMQHPPNRVILLERGARVGKKLLATGNGRCNLTNLRADCTSYGEQSDSVRFILQQYPPQQVIDFFAQLGLLCRTENDDRVYPLCGQSASVLDVLRLGLQREGVEERCTFEVTSVLRCGNAFRMSNAAGETLLARRVIVACGGASSPANGGCSGGYALLQAQGHHLQKLLPALVPITTDWPRLKSLKGIRCRAAVTLVADDTPLRTETGELQWNDNAISGICIFQLSELVSEFFSSGKIEGKRYEKLWLSVNLFPENTAEEVSGMIHQHAKLFSALNCDQLLTGLLHKKIAYELLRTVFSEPAGTGIASIPSSKLDAVIRLCRDWRFSLTGTLDFRNAQVTAGGILCSEFDPKTLESKKVPGLYACGEVLNVNGPCGGYNLQWAWSSGLTAGASAGKAEKIC